MGSTCPVLRTFEPADHRQLDCVGEAKLLRALRGEPQGLFAMERGWASIADRISEAQISFAVPRPGFHRARLQSPRCCRPDS